MNTYLVEWQIHVEAETPEDAARIARKVQLDPNSMADHFNVLIDDGKGGCVSVNTDSES